MGSRRGSKGLWGLAIGPWLALATVLWLALAGIAAAAAPQAGPPYPDAQPGRRVYDYAGIFAPVTETQAQTIIEGIETRTGAQVAVYTQVKPESDTLDLANADALALMNQWGVGRKGFDDGLVILFDMQANLRHGQVSLYAGSGYRAAFLSDEDRQAIFDNDMYPLLVDGALDEALLAALAKVDANATPEHAAALERGRQLNALLVLGALLLGVALFAAAFLAWLRHGRDAVYLDDASIYLPAPPAKLTPPMATLLLADRTSDRTVTAALVDLAARHGIAFTQPALHADGTGGKAGIRLLDSGANADKSEGRILDAIERYADVDREIAHGRLYHLLGAFDEMKEDLERIAVGAGWLVERPSVVTGRWTDRGILEIAAGMLAGFLVFFFPASFLFVLSLGLVVAGVATLILARSMPARTKEGAMLYAMLAAYKRTLAATMAQSRSIEAVAESHVVPWIGTPDQVMAWSIAFGLDRELERLLTPDTTNPEAAAAAATTAWAPSWWIVTSSSSGHGHGSAGSAAGLFSASAIPDPGALLSALGSIASAPSPSTSSGGGSSGSSGFSSSFGGGGGGGGGGAGGGF